MKPKVKTIGISPKVWVPGLGQLIVGGAFLLLGLDVEGKTALATGLATLAAGFAAPNAETVTEHTDPAPESAITPDVD